MTSRNRNLAFAAPRQAAGFTLLEMLVVILVMSLIMGMLAAYGPQKSHWLETRGAAQNLAGAMAEARGRAIATGTPVALKLPAVPEWLTETASGPITFEPDGSATGGTVTLTEQARSITVTVDWLTARVGVHEE
jgi:general secretion pathway protein H